MDQLNKINFISEFNNVAKNNNYDLVKKHNEININHKNISFDYFDDFVLVNEDILIFLHEHNIIDPCRKEQFHKVKYIFQEERILLIFNECDNGNLYEIGKWDSDGNFIIEYLIKEEKNKQENIIFFCNI